MNNDLSDIVAGLDATIIENHRFDHQLFEKLNESQRELGLLSGDRPFSPFLRPKLMTRSMYDRISRASEVLASAFDLMTMAALGSSEIMAELCLTETEERYARMDPGYPGVCNSSRLDAFLAGTDFRFLEYNGETPAGISDQMQIEKVLEHIPEVREFLSRNRHWLPRPNVKLLEGLVSAYRDFGGEKQYPNIAIVDWDGVSTFTEFEVLQQYFESEEYRTIIVDPDVIEYDGSKLFVGDDQIDIFYKRVLIHELFERSDDNHPLRRAYADGNICMANSFRTKIPHKKASLAVLGDEKYADIFTAEQLEMIRMHLPWTRVVRDTKTTFEEKAVDLIEFARNNRDRFILKPNDDYGGSGIVIGWECTESDWDDALERAIAEPFVVQERAPVQKVMFPTYNTEAVLEELLIDFDPFIFRGKVEGGLVRLSPQSLVNVAAGGGETSLAVLEDI